MERAQERIGRVKRAVGTPVILADHCGAQGGPKLQVALQVVVSLAKCDVGIAVLLWWTGVVVLPVQRYVSERMEALHEGGKPERARLLEALGLLVGYVLGLVARCVVSAALNQVCEMGFARLVVLEYVHVSVSVSMGLGLQYAVVNLGFGFGLGHWRYLLWV